MRVQRQVTFKAEAQLREIQSMSVALFFLCLRNEREFYDKEIRLVDALYSDMHEAYTTNRQTLVPGFYLLSSA